MATEQVGVQFRKFFIPTYLHSPAQNRHTQRHTHRVHGSRRLVSVTQETGKSGRVTNILQTKIQPTLELFTEKKGEQIHGDTQKKIRDNSRETFDAPPFAEFGADAASFFR